MSKAGIAVDAWKLPIFERHLSQSGYVWTNAGELSPGTLLLTVTTDNPGALEIVLRAANTEAAKTGAAK